MRTVLFVCSVHTCHFSTRVVPSNQRQPKCGHSSSKQWASQLARISGFSGTGQWTGGNSIDRTTKCAQQSETVGREDVATAAEHYKQPVVAVGWTGTTSVGAL